MRIARLAKAQRGLVLDLDPLMLLDRLEFPDTFALIAVETDAVTQENLPAGLLIASLREQEMMIEWLYVAPERRMQGIGEQLLIAAFECAQNMGVVHLCAYLNQEYGRGLVCAGEERYLREHLFYEERLLGGEWICDIRMLAMQNRLREKTVLSENIRSLRELGITKSMEAIADLQRMEACEMLYEVDAKKRYYDPELSYVLTDAAQVRAGMLIQCVERLVPQINGARIVRTKEHVYYPVLFCAQDAQDAQAILSAALRTAVAQCDHSAQVRVILKSSRYAELMNRILPGQRIDNKYLIASVDDYVHAWENDIQEISMRRLLQLG